MAKIRELGDGLLEVTFESGDPFVPDASVWYTEDAWLLEKEFNEYIQRRLYGGDDNSD